MKNILLAGVGAIASLVIGGDVAIGSQYCNDGIHDYEVGEFYVLGYSYPVFLDEVEDANVFTGYMEFDGEVIIYSSLGKFMMVNGEYVEIYGFRLDDECEAELIVYSPRLEVMGFVPAESVSLPQ